MILYFRMARDPLPFKVLDHTADVGVEAYGASRAQAFENAALAMFSLMCEPDQVEEREERGVRVEAEGPEGLLVSWLSELLYLSEVEGLLFHRFEISEMSNQRLEGRAWGEPIDQERHSVGTGVKAVTRHLLEIKQENSKHLVRVIFDI